MDTFQALVLGAVQGITEFLPISSSGHLVALPFLLNWQEHSLAFDVALHFGTVIALLVIFWKDWLYIIGSAFGFRGLSSRAIELSRRGDLSERLLRHSAPRNDTNNPYPSNLLWQIAVASVPAAGIGIILDRYIERYFHAPLLLAANFVVFGFILWLVDRKSTASLEPSKISYKKSLAIGFAQSIALIPGVSRSGITMTAARLIGLNRENAARYSFIIGMPAMIGAFIFKLKDLNPSDITLAFWAGLLASVVFGIFAINFLLNYLRKADFSVFLLYRVIFALFIILYLLF